MIAYPTLAFQRYTLDPPPTDAIVTTTILTVFIRESRTRPLLPKKIGQPSISTR